MKRDTHVLPPWQIESDVPVPDTEKTSYPFARMKVGESVFFERMDGYQRRRASSAAYAVGNRKGWKFSSRTADGGLRIWRIE
jgi:hypothetical protein